MREIYKAVAVAVTNTLLISLALYAAGSGLKWSVLAGLAAFMGGGIGLVAIIVYQLVHESTEMNPI